MDQLSCDLLLFYVSHTNCVFLFKTSHFHLCRSVWYVSVHTLRTVSFLQMDAVLLLFYPACTGIVEDTSSCSLAPLFFLYFTLPQSFRRSSLYSLSFFFSHSSFFPLFSLSVSMKQPKVIALYLKKWNHSFWREIKQDKYLVLSDYIFKSPFRSRIITSLQMSSIISCFFNISTSWKFFSLSHPSKLSSEVNLLQILYWYSEADSIILLKSPTEIWTPSSYSTSHIMLPAIKHLWVHASH